jgi:hypothetical protein
MWGKAEDYFTSVKDKDLGRLVLTLAHLALADTITNQPI